jgi:uncharacterized membrane protein
MQRLIAGILTLAAVCWIAVILSIPLTADRGFGFGSVVYTIAALVCHQRPERSFHISGVQLPVCARCTGLYLAGALGAVAAWFGIAANPRRTRAVILIAALPTAFTVAIEWAAFAAPTNLLRAAAALPLGAAAGWLFVRMLRAESQQPHTVQSAQF